MKKGYKHNFYKDRHQSTLDAANTVLSLVVDAIPEVNSAVDFGCGVGTWLSVLREKGVENVLGLEGPWVEDKLLKIPQDSLKQVNFEQGVKLDSKYDLAISLEVAEHLKPETAKSFVQSITNASDFILFSAAVPFQGGTNHVNEQWPEYWIELYKEQGYVLLDFVRMKVWDDETIPYWYRQNALFFVKEQRIGDVKLPDMSGITFPGSVIHPDMYLSKMQKMYTVKGSFKLFLRAVGKKLRNLAS